MRPGGSRLSLTLGIGVVVLLLDQFTKYLVVSALVPGQSVPIVKEMVALTLVFNPGLAFGFLSVLPPGYGWIVVLLSIVALVVLIALSLKLLPTGGWPVTVALGMIFGGAAGNLIDRYRYSAVVDFLDLSWRGYHWPAFNVADSGITVGVCVLALYLLRRQPHQSS
jgi:signal peptidase II